MAVQKSEITYFAQPRRRDTTNGQVAPPLSSQRKRDSENIRLRRSTRSFARLSAAHRATRADAAAAEPSYSALAPIKRVRSEERAHQPADGNSGTAHRLMGAQGSSTESMRRASSRDGAEIDGAPERRTRPRRRQQVLRKK
ncbi:hypothetical protein MRX96_030645 [Rhipicephalus microplus]